MNTYSEADYPNLYQEVLKDYHWSWGKFNPNNRYTRAGNNGKVIICPECNNKSTVFHFSWSALGCPNCKYIVDKYDWRLV